MNESNLSNEEPLAYVIRQATVDDLQRIVEIWQQGLGSAVGAVSDAKLQNSDEVYSSFEKSILLQDENFKFWVYVQSDGIIVSWCSILPFQPNPLFRNAWGIMSMYVDRAFQNKMHGYYFSKYVLEDCSKTSIRYVLSIVSSSNDRVIRLSKKMGFVSLGALPHNQPDNELGQKEFMLYEA